MELSSDPSRATQLKFQCGQTGRLVSNWRATEIKFLFRKDAPGHALYFISEGLIHAFLVKSLHLTHFKSAFALQNIECRILYAN